MVKGKSRKTIARYSKDKSILWFHVVLNSIFLLFTSLSSYVHIPLSGIKDYTFYGIHLFLLQFSVFGFLYFLSLNKWIFKTFFNVLFIALGLFAFWVYTQDISITDSLIEVVLETKPRIVVGVLSWQYLLYIGLLLLALYCINKRYNTLEKKFSPITFVLAVFGICLFFIIENKRHNTLMSRLPYNAISGIHKYFKKERLPIKNISKPVNAANTDLNIVFVLGETVRADHLGLNGYVRNTTPLLSQRSNILSFPIVYSFHEYTSASLPIILSDDNGSGAKPDSLTSVYSVFNKAGFETTWIGNQELETGFEDLARTNKNVQLVDSLRSVFSFKKALDEALLPPFKKSLINTSPKFITLQMMGSHWYYNNRYTEDFKTFLPVTDSKYVPSQSKQQMINSYDNTILYMDYFVDSVIKELDTLDKPTLLIYLSDHGELLGEDDMWLHAQPSEYAKYPAMFMWFSESFREKYPKKVAVAKSKQTDSLTTAFFYHTLLDIIEAEDVPYDENRSLFCDKDAIKKEAHK